MIAARLRLDRAVIAARSRLDQTAIVEFFHDLSAPSDGDLTVPRVGTYRRDEKTIADHRGHVMKIVRSRAVHGEKRIRLSCLSDGDRGAFTLMKIGNPRVAASRQVSP